MEIKVGNIYERVGSWANIGVTGTRIKVVRREGDDIEIQELDKQAIEFWRIKENKIWKIHQLRDNSSFMLIGKRSHLPIWF